MREKEIRRFDRRFRKGRIVPLVELDDPPLRAADIREAVLAAAVAISGKKRNGEGAVDRTCRAPKQRADARGREREGESPGVASTGQEDRKNLYTSRVI